jgi:hypothetical protein
MSDCVNRPLMSDMKISKRGVKVSFSEKRKMGRILRNRVGLLKELPTLYIRDIYKSFIRKEDFKLKSILICFRIAVQCISLIPKKDTRLENRGEERTHHFYV